jgi:hypothetical protein
MSQSRFSLCYCLSNKLILCVIYTICLLIALQLPCFYVHIPAGLSYTRNWLQYGSYHSLTQGDAMRCRIMFNTVVVISAWYPNTQWTHISFPLTGHRARCSFSVFCCLCNCMLQVLQLTHSKFLMQTSLKIRLVIHVYACREALALPRTHICTHYMVQYWNVAQAFV